MGYQTAVNIIVRSRPTFKPENTPIEFFKHIERWMLASSKPVTTIGI